jgi:hypothetical protein
MSVVLYQMEPLVNVFPTEKNEILASYSFSCVPLIKDLLIPNCYKNKKSMNILNVAENRNLMRKNILN